MQPPTQSINQKSRPPRRHEGPSLTAVLFYLTLTALACVGATILLMNLMPYIGISRALVRGVSIPFDVLSGLPFVGKFAPGIKAGLLFAAAALALWFSYREAGRTGLAIVLSLGMFLIFGGVSLALAVLMLSFVTICQILWIVILFDREALVNATRESRRLHLEIGDASQYEGTSRTVVRAVKSLPVRFIESALLLACIFYPIDFMIGWSAYPPCVSMNVCTVALATGRWSAIDGHNLFRLFVMVAGSSLVAFLLLTMGNWAEAQRGSTPKDFSNE